MYAFEAHAGSSFTIKVNQGRYAGAVTGSVCTTCCCLLLTMKVAALGSLANDSFANFCKTPANSATV